MSRWAVVLFSKSPAADACKTRLRSALTADAANTLQAALIQDIWHQIASDSPYDLWVAAPSLQSLSYFAPLTHLLLIQEGRTLGDKMRGVAAQLFAAGYFRVILIGSDMPLMTRHLLNAAYHRLQRADCVLGPARDGGYYLIGLKPNTPDVFARVPWGTDQVLCATLQILRRDGASHALLPVHRDIDTWDDVQYYAKFRARYDTVPHFTVWCSKTLNHLQSPSRVPAYAGITPHLVGFVPTPRKSH